MREDVGVHRAERRLWTVGHPVGEGAQDLSFYDLQMRRVVEPGGFTLWAGTSSAETKESHFTVTGDTLVLEPSTPRMQ